MTTIPEAETLSDVEGTPFVEEEDLYVAPQWKLVWWRFRRHRVAVISALVIILFYLIAIFAEFLAIHDPQAQSAKRAFVPPQRIHFEGMRPFVYGLEDKRNPETLQMEHYPDLSKKYPLQFFVEGHKYKLLGLFETNIHLAGLDVAQLDDEDRALMPLYPLGTDRLGRDSWSRLMYGTRISMSIGLVGVGLSLFLGILLGGISGYRGGRADIIIQRLIELRRAMPTIPLWLGLGAAVPQQWSVVKVYFAMTIIISLIGWTTLAREVRGRFLAMREEDYILACRLQGVSELRIIFRHMLPGFVSHIIATTTLAIPAIIIAETSLSFLGLGLRAPAISWGTLLFEAQNLQSVANAPWLLMPGSFLLVAVLAFNFAGDGLRDAADPYQVQQ